MESTILGVPVPVFGCTGPRYSGKTILGGSLAPGAFPEGHPHAGKFRTLILDFEGSSETYALPAERIDVPAQLRQKFGAKAYKQVDAFIWFRELYQSIPVGRFDVIMIDPISDVEAGGVIWAREHPGSSATRRASSPKWRQSRSTVRRSCGNRSASTWLRAARRSTSLPTNAWCGRAGGL